jgi:hypothetical protein
MGNNLGTYMAKLANGTSYLKDIEVYKLKENLKTPISESPNEIANNGIGDLVVIFDNQVWVRNWNDNHQNEFVRAIYSPEFVRINTNIFDKQ